MCFTTIFFKKTILFKSSFYSTWLKMTEYFFFSFLLHLSLSYEVKFTFYLWCQTLTCEVFWNFLRIKMPRREQMGAVRAHRGRCPYTCHCGKSWNARYASRPLLHPPLCWSLFSHSLCCLWNSEALLQARLPELETSHTESSGNWPLIK